MTSIANTRSGKKPAPPGKGGAGKAASARGKIGAGSAAIAKRNAEASAAGDDQGPSDASHNPLIDDLLDELSPPDSEAGSMNGGRNSLILGRPPLSSQNPSGAPAALGGFDMDALRSVSARLQRSAQSNGLGRSTSTAAATSAAVEAVASTTQHYIHAMRMNQLDGYLTTDDPARRQRELQEKLKSKSTAELTALVSTLVEMLDDVRVANQNLGPVGLNVEQLMGDIEKGRSNSLMSTMSTASMMRPPVAESNQVAIASDNQGNVRINSYNVIANLGSGAYGKVKLGEEVSTGNKVAIKIIEKRMLKKRFGASGDNSLNREIAIMKKVRHRNCVSLHEVIDDPSSKKLYLIMDYIPNGPIVQLKQQKLLPAFLQSVEKGKPVVNTIFNRFLVRCAVRHSATGGDTALNMTEIHSEPLVFFCKPVQQSICALYLRQLVSGLRYLHKRDVVHHDIKPDNILLGYDHHVYFTDFGVSEILKKEEEAVADANSNAAGGNVSGHAKKQKLGGGTLLFMAPELVDSSVDQDYVDPFQTDVWALGVTMYCLLVGYVPFSGTGHADVCQNICTKPFPWNDKNAYNQDLMPEWRPLLDGMLNKNPTKRWTLLKLKNYLDGEVFQDALAEQKAREEVMENFAGVSPSIAGRGSAVGGSVAVSPSKNSSLAAGKTNPASASLSNTRTSLTSAARSSSGVGGGRNGHTNPNTNRGDHASELLELNDRDVQKATKQGTVAVVPKTRSKVSPHTEEIIQRYVASIRERLQDAGKYFSAVDHAPATTVDEDDEGIIVTTVNNVNNNIHRSSVAPNAAEVPLPNVAHHAAAAIAAAGAQRSHGSPGKRKEAPLGGGTTVGQMMQRIGSGSALDEFLSMVDLDSGSGSLSMSNSNSFGLPLKEGNANAAASAAAAAPHPFARTQVPGALQNDDAENDEEAEDTSQKKLPYITKVQPSNTSPTNSGAGGESNNSNVALPPAGRRSPSTTPSAPPATQPPTSPTKLASLTPARQRSATDSGSETGGDASSNSPAPVRMAAGPVSPNKHRFRANTTSPTSTPALSIPSAGKKGAGGRKGSNEPYPASAGNIVATDVPEGGGGGRRGSRVSNGKLLPAMTSYETTSNGPQHVPKAGKKQR